MTPIGLLMIEHRLIERMVKLLNAELHTMEETAQVDTDFLLVGVDFFQMYADRTHHGKEEDILFKQLAAKPLSEDHRRMMDELIQEHVRAREAVSRIAAANDLYLQGRTEALGEIVQEVQALVDLYPAHIRKEDKQFFLPALGYLADDEQQAMLDRFRGFDVRMIHEKYKRVVEESEGRTARSRVLEEATQPT
jgi:hemerythrin-like domain-containing protein